MKKEEHETKAHKKAVERSEHPVAGKPPVHTDDEKQLPIPESEKRMTEEEPKDPKDKKIKQLKGALVYLMENAVSANYNHVNYIKGFLND